MLERSVLYQMILVVVRLVRKWQEYHNYVIAGSEWLLVEMHNYQ